MTLMRTLLTLVTSLLGLRLARHWSGAVVGALVGHFASTWLERRWRTPAAAGPAGPASAQADVDDYATLGLHRGASQPEIEQAWRRLMARHHPDRATETGRAEAERRCGEINAAYRRLRRRKTS